MSQSRQSNTTVADSAGTSSEANTLVESYAEDLMDEIFDDVDRILAGHDSAVFAESPVTSEEPAALFSAEAVTVPAMIVPFTAEQAVEPTAAPITETETDSTETDKQTADQSAKKRPWKKLALGAVCLSTLATLGVWWMRQQPALLQSTTSPVLPTTTPVSNEAAFGEYLKRSLRVISGERSAQVETQGSGIVANTPTQLPGNQVPKPSSGVIERVFVPLLQPGSSINPRGSQNTASLPSPSLPAPTNATDQANRSSPVPNIAATNRYELVGVLELGDRSAALFEINGSSQRVYIGETIGSSGWNIVSIDNEEVVVRRNGEVRSIYIGQQF
ncbi:MAG: hypothetical protein AAGA46_08245 [Cyanobacteria bacterium P01_F01_bin.13]